MAKKQEQESDYKSEIKRLKECGPDKLYFIYGSEDYLSNKYLEELRKACLPNGDDGFSLKIFEGPGMDLKAFQSALNSMPFLSERIFIELHNVDINKLPDAEAFLNVMKEIPEYCTAAFLQDFTYEPDGRLKLVKYLKTNAHVLFFNVQENKALVSWIQKRFSAYGKIISYDACERLMFVSGTLMNRLIPEIEKAAGYAAGEQVTVSDIDAVANHIPEADVFEMVEQISKRNLNSAMRILCELLYDKKTEPIAVIALIGRQFRRIYGVKLALLAGKGYDGAAEILGTNWSKIVNEAITAAKGFSLKKLMDAVELCADTDYQMKSSSVDDAELLKDLILRLGICDEKT